MGRLLKKTLSSECFGDDITSWRLYIFLCFLLSRLFVYLLVGLPFFTVMLCAACTRRLLVVFVDLYTCWNPCLCMLLTSLAFKPVLRLPCNMSWLAVHSNPTLLSFLPFKPMLRLPCNMSWLAVHSNPMLLSSSLPFKPALQLPCNMSWLAVHSNPTLVGIIFLC